MVAVSLDHGVAFAQVRRGCCRPPGPGDSGDRDFIAAGPGHRLFLTWVHGPSAAKVETLCGKAAVSAYARGNLNAVIQVSGNSGAT